MYFLGSNKIFTILWQVNNQVSCFCSLWFNTPVKVLFSSWFLAFVAFILVLILEFLTCEQKHGLSSVLKTRTYEFCMSPKIRRLILRLGCLIEIPCWTTVKIYNRNFFWPKPWSCHYKVYLYVFPFLKFSRAKCSFELF